MEDEESETLSLREKNNCFLTERSTQLMGPFLSDFCCKDVSLIHVDMKLLQLVFVGLQFTGSSVSCSFSVWSLHVCHVHVFVFL